MNSYEEKIMENDAFRPCMQINSSKSFFTKNHESESKARLMNIKNQISLEINNIFHENIH